MKQAARTERTKRILLSPLLRQARAAGSHAGQALTEFLVVSLVLIPLFLLIPMIGKYQDISHATQLASRYAAFDAVLRNDSENAWKTPALLAAHSEPVTKRGRGSFRVKRTV